MSERLNSLEGTCGHPRLVPFLEKRTFDFTNLFAGATNNDISIVLCPAFCVLDYNWVRLSVRVHALSMALTSSQALSFFVYGAMPSEEDPTQEFVDETSTFLRVDISSGVSVPSLISATGTSPDAYLRIVLRATQTSSPATLTAQLSACLLLRPL